MERIEETIKQKAGLYLRGSNDPIAEVECEITGVVGMAEGTQLKTLDTWSGTLQILKEYQSIRGAIVKNKEGKLQLEDGRSGKIIITDFPEDSQGGIGSISFQGSGPLE
ncbi:hypothetical protein ES703_49684 [subsurface metagenome]